MELSNAVSHSSVSPKSSWNCCKFLHLGEAVLFFLHSVDADGGLSHVSQELQFPAPWSGLTR